MLNIFRKKPSAEFIKDLCTVPARTPDLPLLLGRPRHLLFDYGQQLPFPRMSDAYTVEKMSLWNKDPEGDGITAVAMRMASIAKAKIFGSLYVLSTEDLVKLDKAHQNGVFFKRKRVPVNTPHFNPSENEVDNNSKLYAGNAAGTYQLNRAEAWMYVGLSDQWAGPIDWATSFYKGYGNFRLANLFNTPANQRQLQIPNHYRYEPVEEAPFKMRTSSHVRSWAKNEDVRSQDMTARENYEKERKLNPTIHETRKFIYISSKPATDAE